MEIVRYIMVCAFLLSGFAQGDMPPDGGHREWTNTEGKKIVAEYLGVRDDSVMVRMVGGKIVPIPLAGLAGADQAFVRDNPLKYLEPWKGWPEIVGPEVKMAVTETTKDKNEYVYETTHFRFHVDGNLGAPLMKDLAQVFELTYALHLKSPFGILARPEGDRFEASLLGKSETYWARGGPQRSAGVYLSDKKVFLAPLDLMGVKVESSVWRRIPRSRCDTTTVIHELTHMLTHDMLVTLPLWVNEGYAEYIANIPIEGNAFRASRDKIREGVIDSFVLDYEKWFSRRGGKIPKLGPAYKSSFLKERLPVLPPVNTVLGVTNEAWRHESKTWMMAYGDSTYRYSEMMGRYRTAHLIIYYFLHLDGEAGVSKLCRYVARKKQMAEEVAAYRAAHKEYERKLEEFFKLPGVEKLDDGRYRFPHNLNPPTAPKPPFGDNGEIESSGMEILYAEETPEALGRKIEDAIRKDLELPLRFTKTMTSR